MSIFLVPELSLSGWYEIIMTAMDVFFRYLFAYPTSYQNAKTNANVIINIVIELACLSLTHNSDKGSAFVSHVTKVVAVLLVITLKHANTKHAQTKNIWATRTN